MRFKRKRGIAPLNVSDFWEVRLIEPIRLFAYEAGPMRLLVKGHISGRLPDNSSNISVLEAHKAH